MKHQHVCVCVNEFITSESPRNSQKECFHTSSLQLEMCFLLVLLLSGSAFTCSVSWFSLFEPKNAIFLSHMHPNTTGRPVQVRRSVNMAAPSAESSSRVVSCVQTWCKNLVSSPEVLLYSPPKTRNTPKCSVCGEKRHKQQTWGAGVWILGNLTQIFGWKHETIFNL